MSQSYVTRFKTAIISWFHLVAPSRDGLEAARSLIRDYLGWEDVRSQLRDRNLEETDPIRWETLTANLDGARKKIPGAIQQAYSVVITVSEKNEVTAFKIAAGDKALFAAIKEDGRSRIQDTSISADALLPGGPYDLWREGEPSRRVKDLVGAFAESAQLPKMLNRRAILDTLVSGCKEGLFVLRLTRPDRSVKTFWMQEPDDASLKESSLEAVLPEMATLTGLGQTLIVPGVLPGLWAKPAITFKELKEYFSGNHVFKIQREGYEEPRAIPHADEAVLFDAVNDAVIERRLWIVNDTASIYADSLPKGILTDDATLQAPPTLPNVKDILPENLPEAWSGGVATAASLLRALSQRLGQPLPWKIFRETLDGAFRAQVLERTVDSSAVSLDVADAANLKFRLPDRDVAPPQSPPLPTKPGVLVAEADLRPNQIQGLADSVADITKAVVGQDIKFRVRIELGGPNKPNDEAVKKINEILNDISSDLHLKS